MWEMELQFLQQIFNYALIMKPSSTCIINRKWIKYMGLQQNILKNVLLVIKHGKRSNMLCLMSSVMDHLCTLMGNVIGFKEIKNQQIVTLGICTKTIGTPVCYFILMLRASIGAKHLEMKHDYYTHLPAQKALRR